MLLYLPVASICFLKRFTLLNGGAEVYCSVVIIVVLFKNPGSFKMSLPFPIFAIGFVKNA